MHLRYIHYNMYKLELIVLAQNYIINYSFNRFSHFKHFNNVFMLLQQDSMTVMRVDIRGETTKIFVRRLIVRLLGGWSFSLSFFFMHSTLREL